MEGLQPLSVAGEPLSRKRDLRMTPKGWVLEDVWKPQRQGSSHSFETEAPSTSQPKALFKKWTWKGSYGDDINRVTNPEFGVIGNDVRIPALVFTVDLFQEALETVHEWRDFRARQIELQGEERKIGQEDGQLRMELSSLDDEMERLKTQDPPDENLQQLLHELGQKRYDKRCEIRDREGEMDNVKQTREFQLFRWRELQDRFNHSLSLAMERAGLLPPETLGDGQVTKVEPALSSRSQRGSNTQNKEPCMSAEKKRGLRQCLINRSRELEHLQQQRWNRRHPGPDGPYAQGLKAFLHHHNLTKEAESEHRYVSQWLDEDRKLMRAETKADVALCETEYRALREGFLYPESVQADETYDPKEEIIYTDDTKHMIENWRLDPGVSRGPEGSAEIPPDLHSSAGTATSFSGMSIELAFVDQRRLIDLWNRRENGQSVTDYFTNRHKVARKTSTSQQNQVQRPKPADETGTDTYPVDPDSVHTDV